jgi:uncharacterized protein (DUF1330 family)
MRLAALLIANLRVTDARRIEASKVLSDEATAAYAERFLVRGGSTLAVLAPARVNPQSDVVQLPSRESRGHRPREAHALTS